MFDIGFWELLIIGVVGLLVIGPERLPGVATMLGQWVGRLRRFANQMRSEIQDELEAEHLKQVLEEQNREMQSLRSEVSRVREKAESATGEAAEEVKKTADEAKKTADEAKREMQDESGERPARDGTTDE